jgi:hypothetical protein
MGPLRSNQFDPSYNAPSFEIHSKTVVCRSCPEEASELRGFYLRSSHALSIIPGEQVNQTLAEMKNRSYCVPGHLIQVLVVRWWCRGSCAWQDFTCRY